VKAVVVHFGLLDGDGGLDVRKLTLHEIAFVGVCTYTMVDFRETVRAMADGKLGSLDGPCRCPGPTPPVRSRISRAGACPRRRRC